MSDDNHPARAGKDALKQFALVSMEREALRQRLAFLDKQWLELAQSEEIQSLLKPLETTSLNQALESEETPS